MIRTMLWRMLWGTWLAFTAETGTGTIIISPAADTFLSEFSPDHNTGGHTNVAAGTVSNGTRARALLRFEIASHVPAGATITNVALRLHVTRVIMGGGVNSGSDLRRVLAPWNEGAQSGNLGAAAGPGEVTWNHRRAPDAPWNAPGGAIGPDFAAAISGTTAVAGLGAYDFASSPGLVADVQSWLDNPASNFGWALLSQAEDISETARRFASREDLTGSAPRLTVEFTPPVPQFRITRLSLAGNQVQLAWTNGRPNYQVQMRSSLAQPWVNLGPTTNATAVAFPRSGQQAFCRVVQDFTARYQVLFNATWSQQTHPTNFPLGSRCMATTQEPIAARATLRPIW